MCDAHPSFHILPILLLILCNGGLHQSSVLNFLLVKSGLWKTQSSDFSLKIQKSVTFCRFDQLFIENSTLVLQLGVFSLSRRPLGLVAAAADRRCCCCGGGFRRWFTGPEGNELLASSSSQRWRLRALRAGVSEAAPRVRAISPSPALTLTVTLIAAPFPTPASLSDSLCQTHGISCCFYGPPFSNGVLPQLLRLRLPRRRHPPPCVLFRFPLLFWCHWLPHGTHSIFRSLFGPIMFSGKSAG